MNIIENNDLLVKAVQVVRQNTEDKLSDNNSKKKKRELFTGSSSDAKDKVSLSVSLIKVPHIPQNGLVKPISISCKVPHCFLADNTNVLLIARDRRRTKGPKGDHVIAEQGTIQLLKSAGVKQLVSEVMSLSKLKYDNHDYEARRKLAARFDVVLCDSKVFAFVPKFLGKAFYQAKKKPISVNVSPAGVRKSIKDALSSTYLHLSLSGSCGTAQVGSLSQTNDQLVSNIKAVAKVWRNSVPGGWKNVRSVHLKAEKSKSIPLYRSEVSARDVHGVKHPNKFNEKLIAIGSISTLPEDMKVKVKTSGRVVASKIKNYGKRERLAKKAVEAKEKEVIKAPAVKKTGGKAGDRRFRQGREKGAKRPNAKKLK